MKTQPPPWKHGGGCYADTVSLPENAERFAEQSALQAEVRLREFLGNCALARNYGRISRSDSFCGTLESAVRDWYRESVRTGNYGFFFSLLHHAEKQILVNAQRYGERLEAQFRMMMESSPYLFDGHPEVQDAVRGALEQRNYIVAEERMHCVRLGDFSAEYDPPKAQAVLADFWARYDDLYRRTADTSRSLSGLLGIQSNGENPSGLRRLADCWIGAGNPASAKNVEGLLAFLGWKNPKAEAVPFEADERAEVWRVTADAPALPVVGTLFGGKEMYVVSLSGVLDCTRLCEKLRTLDALDGDLLVLLDCALNAADRHALARAMKRRENGFRNGSIVVDRVLAAYLADTCQADTVNRVLLSAALPFSGCLPRVEEMQANRPLPVREARERLAEPLAYLGISLPDSAVLSQILATVNYLPGLIQRYARKLADVIREPDYAGYDVKSTPPYVVGKAHLRRVLSDQAFREQVWAGVLETLDTRAYPLALLMGWMDSVEPSESGYSAADVLRHAEDMRISPLRGLDEQEMEALLRELRDLNILRGVKEDTWTLMSRPFRDSLGSEEELLEKLAEFEEAVQ